MSNTPKPPRPISVIFMQIVAVLGLLGLLWAAIYLAPAIIQAYTEEPSILRLVWLILANAVFYLGGLIYLGLTFYGLQTRKPYGRWLAVSLASLILLASVARLFQETSGPLPEFELTTPEERTGARLGRLFTWVGFGLILLRLIRGQRARLFFGKEGNEAVLMPPAPPLYEQEAMPKETN